MLISIIVLGLLLIAFFKRDRETESRLKAAGRRRIVPIALGSTGLTMEAFFLKWIRRAGGGKKRTEERPRFLKDEETILAEKADFLGISYLLAVIGAIAGIVAGILSGGDGSVEALSRPEFGSERSVDLYAEWDGQKEPVRILVSGREPAAEEIDAIFDAAFEEGKEKWLGENERFDLVKSGLRFFREDDRGIRYEFQSSDPEWISNYGSILAEEIPVGGKPLSVQP